MIIIGEKINGSIPIVAEAIAKRDSEFIKERAKLQAESGATYIDCCASVPEAEEVETFLTLYQERDIRLIRFSRSWLSREMRDGR